MKVQTMTIRITPEIRKKIKMFVAENDMQMQDFFEVASKYIFSLPSDEVSKILKK